jgi:hypothetical protein
VELKNILLQSVTKAPKLKGQIAAGAMVTHIDTRRHVSGKATALSPSMRRPIPVNSFFCSFCHFFHFFPFSQAASVATLPSALLDERFSLGASWVFSIQ